MPSHVGKSDECHVEALHPTISRQHMLLAVDRSLGPFIVDLNSSNGTFVAGTKLLPFKFCVNIIIFNQSECISSKVIY